MILTIGIKNSSQARASIHNGFWFWKLVVVTGIIVGMGYVMFYHFEDKKVDMFLKVWMWIGVATGTKMIKWIFLKLSFIFRIDFVLECAIFLSKMFNQTLLVIFWRSVDGFAIFLPHFF